jgi:hypothetical protein
MDEHDSKAYWKDPLDRVAWVYRPDDPKEYGSICPHCFKRYGEPKNYINVERCKECPPYYPGMEISWTLPREKREEMKKLGYFHIPQKGGRRKKKSDEELSE